MPLQDFDRIRKYFMILILMFWRDSLFFNQAKNKQNFVKSFFVNHEYFGSLMPRIVYKSKLQDAHSAWILQSI